MKISSWLTWIAVLAWMIVIFMLSHQPAAASSQLSSGVTAFVLDIINTIIPVLDLELETFGFFVRKAAHFFAYFILGALLCSALRSSNVSGWRGAIISFGISVLYAISDELHQLFIPGRSGEVRDVLIDSVGALTGILFFLALLTIFQSIYQKKR